MSNRSSVIDLAGNNQPNNIRFPKNNYDAVGSSQHVYFYVDTGSNLRMATSVDNAQTWAVKSTGSFSVPNVGGGRSAIGVGVPYTGGSGRAIAYAYKDNSGGINNNQLFVTAVEYSVSSNFVSTFTIATPVNITTRTNSEILDVFCHQISGVASRILVHYVTRDPIGGDTQSHLKIYSYAHESSNVISEVYASPVTTVGAGGDFVARTLGGIGVSHTGDGKTVRSTSAPVYTTAVAHVDVNKFLTRKFTESGINTEVFSDTTTGTISSGSLFTDVANIDSAWVNVRVTENRSWIVACGTNINNQDDLLIIRSGAPNPGPFRIATLGSSSTSTIDSQGGFLRGGVSVDGTNMYITGLHKDKIQVAKITEDGMLGVPREIEPNPGPDAHSAPKRGTYPTDVVDFVFTAPQLTSNLLYELGVETRPPQRGWGSVHVN